MGEVFTFRGIVAEVSCDEDGWWMALDGPTGMFGEGASREEALLDLVASIGTMLAELTADRERLSPEVMDDLRRFRAALAAAKEASE